MIGRISGILIAKQPPVLLIDVAGVGYEIEAPMTVFYDLPQTGQPLTLVTHLAVKDDSHSLYGFQSEQERSLFRNLLKISGIGAKLALTVLSGISAAELSQLVADGDANALTRLPGIGKKTAERLIIELRDKLDGVPAAGPAIAAGAASAAKTPVAEAVQALVALGYKPAEASRMVSKVDAAEASTEDIIRDALQSRVKA